MKTEIYSYIKERSRLWWTSLIVGVLAIVIGIWCLTTPVATLVGLTYLFILGCLISGIFDIIYSIFNRKIISGWGWTLAGGIMEVMLGLLLISLPLLVVTSILIYLIGFWILFRAIWAIGIATELNNYINAGGLIALSVLSLLFAIFYLFSPWFRGGAVVALASMAFIFYGVFRIYLSFQYRKLNKKIQEHKKEHN